MKTDEKISFLTVKMSAVLQATQKAITFPYKSSNKENIEPNIQKTISEIIEFDGLEGRGSNPGRFNVTFFHPDTLKNYFFIFFYLLWQVLVALK